MAETYLVGLAVLVALLLLLERRRHECFLRTIPLRIHVNGTRGKSTVVRYIAHGLRAGGRRVVAKTTGSAPRIILEDGSEAPIARAGPARIWEQLEFLGWAARRRVDAVVVECMAVRPQYQIASEQIVRPHITVLTNVRRDHLEILPDDPSRVITAMVVGIRPPTQLITPRGTLGAALVRVRGRDIQVTEVDLPDDDLDPLAGDLVLASTVCALVGVSTSREILRQAAPDPGAFAVFHVVAAARRYTAVNAFAANETESTDAIIDSLRRSGVLSSPLTFVYGHRSDRPARARQFAAYLASRPEPVCIIGQSPAQMSHLLTRAGAHPERISMLRGSPSQLVERLAEVVPDGGAAIGIGNFVGAGEQLVDEWRRRSAL